MPPTPPGQPDQPSETEPGPDAPQEPSAEDAALVAEVVASMTEADGGAAPEPVTGPEPDARAIGIEQTRARSAALFVDLRHELSGEATRQEARDNLVHLHLPLVEHCARRFRNRGEPFEDLVQVGTIGLLKSIDRFDTERGVEFSTYATPTIIGEIKRYFRDKGWAIRVPRRLQELRMQISATTAELTQRLGRSPTVSELAEAIGCSSEEIVEGIESSNAYSTLSLDATDNSDDSTMTMLDTIGVDDEGLEHVEIRESLKPLLDQLPAREKKILLLRFFKNMTQSQIAAEIGVSQMHVSRLLARTLDQLRTNLQAED
ncbi:RNA polymerase sigma factor SigF [Nocardioides zeae]|uniref:RNA polymerase sigma-B factor n=2 Tax=Nocardioides zeae TaxID=1457234 RepID=A0AAJ1U521_9ACTN|nr:RNA polymerase sigma factor SigF [Nocardioides zeae]MDQ1103287.1 RNA polymerase sigma-B factor [Nocardioides zeae]